MKIKKIILLLPILTLFNCSLQKRKYQSGYFLSWNKNNLSIAKNEKQKVFNVQKNEIKFNDISFEKDITTSANNKITKIFNNTIKNNLALPDSCDQIIYKDGTEIKAKITEINTSEIRYKRCDFIDGPTFVEKQNKVFMIKYSNGKSEMFKTEKADEYNNGKIIQDSQKINDKDKKTNPFSIASLVFSILGFYPLIILGSILGLIFGVIAINQINKDSNKYKQNSKGLAIAGITISAVGLILWGLIIWAVTSILG
jgi:hypothetical protein